MNYKAFSLHNYSKMPQYEKLSPEIKKDIQVVGSILPFKVNNYVLDELIDWDDPENDPIFRLTFPQKGMLWPSHFNDMANALQDTENREYQKLVAHNIRLQLNPHPAGQSLYNVPSIDGHQLWGLQHKYEETVLFFPSQGQTCHSYCTFCFRWPQFVGIDEFKFAMKETESLIRYLEVHQEVTDILFTGGDPMVMSFKVFEKYIEPFLRDDNKTNIQTIRIGTKVLGFWPYKFVTDADADSFLRLFERITKKGIHLAIMAHLSHPHELQTPVVKLAIERLRSTGAQIRTQSPILRNINDSPAIWAEMWRSQVQMSCIPYYMFIPRDTGAQHYFSLPLIEAWDVFRSAYRQVSGVCRTVRGPSMSCTPGKVQFLGVSELDGQKVFVLRFLQGRDSNWVGRPFFAKYNPDAIWMDELSPAFGNSFFFETSTEQAAVIY